MASSSPIILVTDVPPNQSFSGGLLTYNLCMATTKEFSGFYISFETLAEVKSQLPPTKELSTRHRTKRLEVPWCPAWVPKALSTLASFTRELFRKHYECRKFATEIESYARDQQAKAVWIILQGQTLTWIAEHLIRRRHLKVHVQYWDQPSWWVNENGLNRRTAKLLQRSFEYCLSHAAATAVPSHAAVNMHASVGVKAVPLFSSLKARSGNPDPRNQSVLKIGIAGQLYAEDTISSFIDALKTVNWKVDNRIVEIHHWGSTKETRFDSYLKKRGYLDQTSLIEALGECDVLYCPYWFDPHFKIICQTSSPSKVATYMAAKRPVFFHGPEYSSVVSLLAEQDAGELCHSTAPNTILFHLSRIAAFERSEEIVARATGLLNGKLSPAVMASNFESFLNPHRDLT